MQPPSYLFKNKFRTPAVGSMRDLPTVHDTRKGVPVHAFSSSWFRKEDSWYQFESVSK